ncbi:MAG TPA: helicase HerA-like domain-containing protein, partial [Casimicrobiaceae bacterium]
MPDPLPIAKHGDIEVDLLPALANRHGLITGATGTGKTVTLQVIAERLSGIGVPVFMADVKGDLAGMSQPGAMSPKLGERLKLIGAQPPSFAATPVVFWDIFGEQ